AMVSREGMKKALVHGEDHMGNVSAKYGKDASDRTGFHELAAPEFIYETCKALDSHPDLPQLLCEVVIMGGAFGERRGNRTPSAEANFFDGPEAAQAVLTAGFKRLVLAGMFGIWICFVPVCLGAVRELHQRLSRLGRDPCTSTRRSSHHVPSRTLVLGLQRHPRLLLEVLKFGLSAKCWITSCASWSSEAPVTYLLRPDLFESRNVRVEVETRGEITRGMSIADWKGQWGKERNCTVLRRIRDRDEFYRVFVRAIARLPVSLS
ncbi:unnamed protein product, partial [Symbiodinium sp. CCMP2456]